ncbi:caspase domain-containing protein [Staphylococcus saprophyticus]|uniref:caspase family protein n=1 Tax=Staphylococcus TaxID=1279 RepID=UPI0005EA2415|nr:MULTISPECIES: caspase family protein [Staphylococcus]CPZ28334.1 Uncharacterized protein containing caspase domain [Mycobacteroides abscessus]MBN6851825.1 caspase family protein [Staphylococcus saprophyticus]MDW3893730.1 caspase family protein [Staphylococcus saprophyticus]MDW3933408.1 caspase family protein [Staphylococcus saprophyticus]MDW3958649.1 caspase family protein [Staphylococcus saprophyticus]
MKGALIVGIDYYKEVNSLSGCVNDANNVMEVLESHGDGSPNFECNLLTATSIKSAINRRCLKDNVEELFKKDLDIALFYFAGHGYIDNAGGYIIASDSHYGDEGLALSDILTFANKSPSKNRIIILDSCHSGQLGDRVGDEMATLKEGVTILTASSKDQYATEDESGGVFTNLFVDALNGSASNLKGEITPGSVYSHIDQSLGVWEQRPIFKTNIKQFVSLRQVSPKIATNNLRRISELFPRYGYEYPLNPTYEPEEKGRDEGMPSPEKENTEIFAILQQYNRCGLLEPVDAKHMWNAAMESKSCKLTLLGEHYRKLAIKKRI